MNPLVFVYNLFQIVSWGAVMVLLIYYGVTLPWDQFICLYHDN